MKLAGFRLHMPSRLLDSHQFEVSSPNSRTLPGYVSDGISRISWVFRPLMTFGISFEKGVGEHVVTVGPNGRALRHLESRPILYELQGDGDEKEHINRMRRDLGVMCYVDRYSKVRYDFNNSNWYDFDYQKRYHFDNSKRNYLNYAWRYHLDH